MIPTLDNYFVKRFKNVLNAILSSVDDKDSETYVINDVLQGYSQDEVESFKNSFCIYKGKAKYPIDVLLSYPNGTTQTKACYVVTRDSGEEDTDNSFLGNTSSNTYGFGRAANGENVVDREAVVIHEPDEKGYYAETKYPILNMISIAEMSSYIDTENFVQGSNKFRLLNCERFVGKEIHVSYIRKDTGIHKDYSSRGVGIPFKESISIDALSNNTTTTRELDTLLKYALIIMRDSGKESNYYQLPAIKMEPLSTLKFDNADSPDSPVYVIKTVIEYATTYQISKDSATKIKDILLKLE